MNYVEQLFGFAPDGGSGSLEFLLLLVPLVGIGLLRLRDLARLRRTSRR